MKLTAEHMHKYFEARLGRALPFGKSIAVRCPFHDDKTPSLSVDASKGVCQCFTGCVKGGVVDFEMRFSNCDRETAWENIAEVCGLADQRLFQQEPELIYSYTDEDGRELSQKLRYAGKRFSQRARGQDGKWTYSLIDVRKVLYSLPEVITATDVAICEGEKDCDNLKAANLASLDKSGTSRLAATTNFDGAGKWRPDYSPYMTGKRVVIFLDNDQIGKAHGEQVAASIFPYARSVRIVELPGLPPKGDVSDYLESHTAEQLLAEVLKTPFWKPRGDKLLIPAPRFLSTASPSIEWTVEEVIQRGSNGVLCSFPKVGKSWAAADLAIALALSLPWLGFDIPRPVRTALITREDNPALTKWRMDRLLRGRGRERYELEGRLFVNSREQSPAFRLDQPELLAPMIAELKEIKPEFAILDVFNVLHGADENDNTEMRAVMEQLNIFQREAGCAIAVVHHFTKNSEGSLTQRIRGAGAIAGWAEWAIGIEGVRSEKGTRRMEFELKAGESPEPIFYEIKSDDANTSSVIGRVERPSGKTSSSRLDEFIQ